MKTTNRTTSMTCNALVLLLDCYRNPAPNILEHPTYRRDLDFLTKRGLVAPLPKDNEVIVTDKGDKLCDSVLSMARAWSEWK